MGRWIGLFSAAIAIAGLTACAEPARPLDAPAPAENTIPETTPPSPPPPAETAAAPVATASSTASAKPPHRSRAPHEDAIEALLKQDPESAGVDDRVYVLLPRRRPANEPAYMALAFSMDLGKGAGQWTLFRVANGQARSLGTVETLNEACIRLFRTGPDRAVFRRFWFRMVDPTPEEEHKGSYDDLELSPKGRRVARRETPIDTRTAHGRALWGTPRRDMYRCDLESFRSTGTCELEKLGD